MITQLRYDANFNNNNPKDVELAKKYGITSGEDYHNDPAKAAIATMIVLKSKLDTVRRGKAPETGKTWQQVLKDNNAKISNKEEQITEDDLMVLLWNRSPKTVASKMFGSRTVRISDNKSSDDAVDGCAYPRFIRAYREKLFGAKKVHN